MKLKQIINLISFYILIICLIGRIESYSGLRRDELGNRTSNYPRLRIQLKLSAVPYQCPPGKLQVNTDQNDVPICRNMSSA